jgi:uncharacterized protein YidB (DUF937 family)
MRNYWKIGIAAFVMLALAGTAAGIVAAQTGGSTPDATSTQTKSTATPKNDSNATAQSGSDATPEAKQERRDEFLNELADNLGVSREALDGALSDTALSMVDKALADGKITQDEATRIKEKIASGDFPFFGGPGFGHGFEKGFHRGFQAGVKLEDLATFLGVDIAAIHDGMMNGQSLAQIAETHGKSRDELKAYITSNVTEKLKQEVKDGNTTQAQADEKLQSVKDNLDNLIDNTGMPFRGGPGFHGGGPGHHGGPGGFHGYDEGTDEDSSTPGNSTQTSSLTL